ncbi:MAG: hypothetical protein K2N87_13630 [Eubacterium sp.]|nr:hypothetical protein [Eubacterium sp.]
MKADGSWAVSHQAEQAVWKTLFRILRHRMQNGDFTVVDATNSKTKDMDRYILPQIIVICKGTGRSTDYKYKNSWKQD